MKSIILFVMLVMVLYHSQCAMAQTPPSPATPVIVIPAPPPITPIVVPPPTVTIPPVIVIPPLPPIPPVIVIPPVETIPISVTVSNLPPIVVPVVPELIPVVLPSIPITVVIPGLPPVPLVVNIPTIPVIIQPSIIVKSVGLAWDRSPEISVTGYNVHFGRATHTYTNKLNAGNVTNVIISPLIEGATYYFAVTAYNGQGLESDFSLEVSYTVPTEQQPMQRIILIAQQSNSPLGPFTNSPTPPFMLTNSATLPDKFYRLEIKTEQIAN